MMSDFSRFPETLIQLHIEENPARTTQIGGFFFLHPRKNYFHWFVLRECAELQLPSIPGRIDRLTAGFRLRHPNAIGSPHSRSSRMRHETGAVSQGDRH
jgi:hypothetical protein